VAAPTRKLAELFYEIRGRTSGLQSDLKQAETQFGKLADFVKANPIAAVAALGTAIAGVAIQATRMASEVETSLRRVTNTIPDGIQGLDTLREGIAAVSRETGKSQAELAQNLAEIAKGGVEGPEAAVARLKAVQTAVDATGEDFNTVVEGLDQTLDLFGGTSEDAARALGTLFAAAKGHSSLTDLFAQLQAAAPAVNRLNLDLDTTAKALVALGEQGLSPKQAASELNKLADSGATGRKAIEDLAASIQPAGDGLADLTKAANDFNNSAEQLNKRALNDFKAVMIDLGRQILPAVTDELKLLLQFIDKITGATSKRIQTLGLSDLGAKFEEATRETTERLQLQTGSFVKAAQQLAKVVADGQLDIIATTQEGIAGVAAGLEHLKQIGVLKAGEVQATIDALNKAAAKGSGVDLRGGKSGPTGDELEKQAKAAADAQKAVADLADKVTKLGSVQGQTNGVTHLSAQAYADLAVEISKARDKFPQFSEDLDGMAKRLVALRQAASQFEAAELAHEIDTLLASFTATTVDDLTLALGELQKKLREKGATEEQIKQITDLEQSFIDARKASEELDKSLESGRNGALSPLREMVQLLDQQAEAERQLAALKDKGAGFDKTRAELLEQIRKLQERIKELEDENEKKTGQHTQKTRDWGKEVANVAKAAFGVATALLGADNTLTKMIGSASQVADGLSDIAQLAHDAGGLGKLFSSGAGILSAIPAIGQIIGGGAAIASLLGESPERKAATRELHEAADALKRAAGDLSRVSLSGATTAGVQRAVGGITIPEFGPGKINTATEDAVAAAELGKALRQAGISMKDFEQIAKDLGFDFSKGVTAEGLKAFQAALRELDFKAFTDTFEGQLSALEQRFRLFDVSEPSAQFDALIKLLTDPKVGAPALFGALEGLDTKTAEGRAKAKEAIQKIFQGIVDGTITPEMLNGLNLDQLREILDQLFGLLGDTTDQAISLLDKLNAAFADIDVDLEIAGITDPLTKAIKRAAAAVANDPRIAGALAGLDLANEDQRRQAIAALQALADGADKELKQIILELLRSIRDIPDAVNGDGKNGESVIVSNAARGLTETTGNRMADYLATANIIAREHTDLLTEIRDRIAPITDVQVPALVQPPAFSGSLGAAAATSSTAINLAIAPGAFVVNAPSLGDSAVRQQVAADLSRQVIRNISEGLGREARQILRAKGISVA